MYNRTRIAVAALSAVGAGTAAMPAVSSADTVCGHAALACNTIIVQVNDNDLHQDSPIAVNAVGNFSGGGGAGSRNTVTQNQVQFAVNSVSVNPPRHHGW
jgi:hypothetical protein